VNRLLRALVLLSIGGCGPAAPDECLLATSTDCAVGYSPTYTNIFQQSLRGTCGGPGVSCHGIDGAHAGLVFASEQESYDLLLGNTGTRPRVIPGDPDASLLVQRLECSSPLRRMPLNSDPLPATVRCAIVKWIAAGAVR
jgi:hypothetical protein